ncbi:hypothetical protein ACFQO7_35510 [Catellatospora aurea]|uniref:DUF4386 family protein n=1 Tax=Catellatospora aurea TaxID=1337874 RepID=A0ABW2H6B1_9ACTN
MVATHAAPVVGVRTAAITATGLGIVHAVLYVISFWILHQVPDGADTDQTVLGYYLDPDHRRWVLIAGIYLMPLAAISFIWFITTLRMWIADHGHPEHALFSNLQLAAGIVYVTLTLVAAAAFTVGAAAVELAAAPVDPSTVRAFAQFGRLLEVMVAMRIAAMFVLATASIGRYTRALPTWFTVVSVLIGLTLLLTATLDARFALLFPVWLFALCVIILTRLRRSGT